MWRPGPRTSPIVTILFVCGRSGLADLVSRFLRRRVGFWIWAVALLFYPALMLTEKGVGLAFGDPWPGNRQALGLGLASLAGAVLLVWLDGLHKNAEPLMATGRLAKSQL